MAADGNATILYFEYERPVGSRLQYCCGYARSSVERVSAYWPCTAYVCPVCGELWGREVLDYHFQYSPIPKTSWVVEARRCAKHGDGYFLSGLGESSLPPCSLELLKREALLLCLNHKEFQNG